MTEWTKNKTDTQSRSMAYSRNHHTPSVENFTVLYGGISELLCISNWHGTLILPLSKKF